jgi:hypothetical protein
MNYKNILFQFILLISFSICIKAQDTITVMQYNLLQYGGSCIPIAGKTADLKTILKYVMPDILGVNEMLPDNTTIDYLRSNALNTDGISYYQRANITNLSNSPQLVNMIYYNSAKLGLAANIPLQTSYRDINIYRFYFKSYDLATTHDTIYINVVVAHLKASQGYEADRATMTNTLMSYLNAINVSNNYLFQGDLNLYTSTEQAYQNLIGNANANMRFYDPINRPGAWNGNSSFKDIHTQSSHNSGNLNNCFVTGGMDDRFDFILISKDVKDGTKKAQYITGSYKAIGQDGQHFNSDLTSSPTNTSAPTSVINALYNCSDHLPVMLKLKISASSQSVVEVNSKMLQISFPNPVGDLLKLNLESDFPSNLKIEVLSVLGSVMYETNYRKPSGSTALTIPFNHPKGMYLLRIIYGNNRIVKKIVKE